MLEDRLDCVYTFVRLYLQQHHFAPSIREIAEGCFISTSYATRCLDVLEAQGRLTRERGRARSIALRSPDDHVED